MEQHWIDLEIRTFKLIMFPLCGINLFLNIFYGCCLISNRHKLRQPLKALLISLVWCGIIFFVHVLVAHPLMANGSSDDLHFHLMWMITMFITHSSMTGTVSMSLYCYMQIVPSQRALLVWLKRNIKSFIYGTFILNEIVIAFSASLNFLSVILESWDAGAHNCTKNVEPLVKPKGTTTAIFTFIKIHILVCMVIMTVCNFSMTCYLFRHIKSRTRKGFAASGTQGQIRVAISEVFQAVLFLICGMLYFVVSFEYSSAFGPLVYLTVVLLYMTGNTVSLATGQAMFRQGAVDVWKALTAPCCASV